ncbi:ribosomal protein S18 acetylase RimI-like enzyme [Kineosphaera limosa]|uniref:Putative ribosomal-protein-alanine acetyltransferase n=1 Tax=Kineosphaera limosa NBRC 100340 TaxID=1184609 RepID=K6XDZ9_9MICO|nr:GNAT family N-acetyltransferase [Kineosphaera limosa]NYD99286.1 ribosomal protein S18 acetylase RimI-like enzyme [Kineosphaera limosa]GAB97064.1 putative ribosomal-protein-alanine acetyltransferase [Kineosphaera limosa NBRC 100340]
MSIRIERAHARDLTKVKRLWKAMIGDYQQLSDGLWEVREPGEAWARRHQQYLDWINDAGGVVFLALDTDTEEIIGYAALHFVLSGATFDLGESYGEIETLAVLPTERGRGVGAALINACRRELDRREVEYMALETLASNTGALRLYERAGFQPFMVRLVRRVNDDES